MRHKNFILGLVAFAALALLPTAARADNLSFSFTPANYVGQAGGTVTLFGTLTNGAGAITFAGAGDSMDSRLSFFGAQAFDSIAGMAGSTSLTNVALFTLMIDPLTADGTVFTFAANQITLFYDPLNGEAAANFSITVRNQAPPGVPEPTTMVLLGTGLIGAAAARRRKRQQQSKLS
jgi:hypothetical protein